MPRQLETVTLADGFPNPAVPCSTESTPCWTAMFPSAPSTITLLMPMVFAPVLVSEYGWPPLPR